MDTNYLEPLAGVSNSSSLNEFHFVIQIIIIMVVHNAPYTTTKKYNENEKKKLN